MLNSASNIRSKHESNETMQYQWVNRSKEEVVTAIVLSNENKQDLTLISSHNNLNI